MLQSNVRTMMHRCIYLAALLVLFILGMTSSGSIRHQPQPRGHDGGFVSVMLRLVRDAYPGQERIYFDHGICYYQYEGGRPLLVQDTAIAGFLKREFTYERLQRMYATDASADACGMFKGGWVFDTWSGDSSRVTALSGIFGCKPGSKLWPLSRLMSCFDELRSRRR